MQGIGNRSWLAGMTLVVLADDAFLFLFAWELMSLSSWALVMAHHRDEGNAHAAFVYLVMAVFSGLTLAVYANFLPKTLGTYRDPASATRMAAWRITRPISRSSWRTPCTQSDATARTARPCR